MYPDVSLYIDGAWCKGAGGAQPVLNPATGDAVGTVPHAGKAELDRALAAAEKGNEAWKKVSAFDRYKVMRNAEEILSGSADEMADNMTKERGKPVAH